MKTAAQQHQGRKRIDWEAIERDYRTGTFSHQELADKHGNVVTRQAVSKRAKQKGWTKDLTTAVRQATRAKVIEAEVAKRVAGNVADRCHETTDAVLVSAEIAKDVILRHRGDVLDLRNLAMEMLGELRLATHSADELASLFKLATSGVGDPDDLQAVQQSFKDMLKLHARVGSLHKLAETLNKLQPLERKAFALDEDGDKGPSAVRTLSNVERAARLATLMERARRAAEQPPAATQAALVTALPQSDVRH